MMSIGTLALAWSPHQGGQDHESTEIAAHYDHDHNDQRNPGDHRNALAQARAERVDQFRDPALQHIRRCS
jgi:hypothetical protein